MNENPKDDAKVSVATSVDVGEGVCEEDDGCPTEIARLQRDWRRMRAAIIEAVHTDVTRYNKITDIRVTTYAQYRADDGLLRDEHGKWMHHKDFVGVLTKLLLATGGVR